MKGRLSGVAVAAVAATVVPAAAAIAAPETEAERTAAIAQPGVVYIETHWRGWVRDSKTGEVFGGVDGYQLTSRCTGFVATADGAIVTAKQCVDPGETGIAPAFRDKAVADLKEAGRITTTAKALDKLRTAAVVEGASEDSPVVRDIYVQSDTAVVTGPTADQADLAQVIGMAGDGVADTAVLQISAGRRPAVAIASAAPSSGTPVVVVGYAKVDGPGIGQPVDPTVTEGALGTVSPDGLPGDVVVDKAGRVVGLVGAAGAAAADPDALAVLPVSEILRELRDAEVTPALGAADRNYRQGLEHLYDGYYTKAIRYFDAVLAAIPSHEQATQLRTEAIDLRTKNGDATDWTTMGMIAGAGAIGLALVGWLLVSVLRGRARKRRARAAAAAAAPAGATAAATEPATEPAATEPATAVSENAPERVETTTTVPVQAPPVHYDEQTTELPPAPES